MIPLAVVVPEERLLVSLAPIIDEARRRQIPVLRREDLVMVPEVRVAVGLDGFIPKAEHRVAVDNWFDCWRHPRDPTQIMCYSTPFHWTTHRELWESSVWATRNDIHDMVVGCLWADGGALLSESERDLAVFFTPKMVPERQARWFRGRHGYYAQAFRAARLQAEREGLKFVIKTRTKHNDPWYLKWLNYEIFGDDTPSLALLRRARWCVHFGSAAALEACAMGAFAYWYPAPEGYLADSPGTDRRPAMFCYPGVSRMGAPNGARLDPVARARFLDTYVGSLDGKAAARVLDVAEGL